MYLLNEFLVKTEPFRVAGLSEGMEISGDSPGGPRGGEALSHPSHLPWFDFRRDLFLWTTLLSSPICSLYCILYFPLSNPCFSAHHGFRDPSKIRSRETPRKPAFKQTLISCRSIRTSPNSSTLRSSRIY